MRLTAMNEAFINFERWSQCLTKSHICVRADIAAAQRRPTTSAPLSRCRLKKLLDHTLTNLAESEPSVLSFAGWSSGRSSWLDCVRCTAMHVISDCKGLSYHELTPQILSSSSLTGNTIVPYSKAWNLKLADKMQTALPPEVRNIIYSYLLDDNMWSKYQHDIAAVTSVVSTDIVHCRCMYHDQGRPRVPHFLLLEYTGGPTTLGIVEQLYNDDWFKCRMLYGQTAGLESLVHNDAFVAGFDPFLNIRSLNICNIHRYR